MAKISRRSLAKVIAARLSVPDADGPAVMLGLAAFLVEHNMTDAVDVIINDIADELYLQSGRLVVEVTSAHPLTDQLRQQLRTHMQQTSGASSVELHEMVDDSLIGGLIARTPSAELDLSVKTKLRQLTGLVG